MDILLAPTPLISVIVVAALTLLMASHSHGEIEDRLRKAEDRLRTLEGWERHQDWAQSLGLKRGEFGRWGKPPSEDGAPLTPIP